MKNEGKVFESDFKKSVPEEGDWWFYRFRDGTASWDGGGAARFQAENLCDCQISKFPLLYLVELKSTWEPRLPHDKIIGSSGKRIKNVEKMVQAGQKRGICAGFVWNCRSKEKTLYIPAAAVLEHITASGRKSIPLEWAQLHGLPLAQRKLRVHWRYDVEALLQQLEKAKLLEIFGEGEAWQCGRPWPCS